MARGGRGVFGLDGNTYKRLGSILDREVRVRCNDDGIKTVAKWGGYDMREGCDVCGEFCEPLFLHLNLKELCETNSDSILLNDVEIMKNEDGDEDLPVYTNAFYFTSDKKIIERLMAIKSKRDARDESGYCISDEDFRIHNRGGIFSKLYTGNVDTLTGVYEMKSVDDVSGATVCHNCYLWLDSPVEFKLVSPFFGFWMDFLEDFIICEADGNDDLEYIKDVVRSGYDLCKPLREAVVDDDDDDDDED